MYGMDVQTLGNKIIFSIDRTPENFEFIISAMNLFRLENSLKEIQFDAQVINFADEIKQSVWEKNKKRVSLHP